MIPYILHQTYKSEDELTDEWKRYRDSWHKDEVWDYRFYNDQDLRNEVKDAFPEYLEKFDSFSHFIERVDFARYVILYKYGGVYADFDMEKLLPFKPLMSNNVVLLASECVEHTVKKFNKHIVLSNACMLSPAKNPYWLSLLHHIVSNYQAENGALKNTGPMAMTTHYEDAMNRGGYLNLPDQTVFSTSSTLQLLPSCFLMPETWTNDISKVCKNSMSFAVHHWSSSWVGAGKGFVGVTKFCMKNVYLLIILLLVVISLTTAAVLLGLTCNNKRS
jgi:mannosyltransferase OCH1-like enzyme